MPTCFSLQINPCNVQSHAEKKPTHTGCLNAFANTMLQFLHPPRQHPHPLAPDITESMADEFGGFQLLFRAGFGGSFGWVYGWLGLA